MPNEKVPLVDDGIYHVFSKSIAGYKIFNEDSEYKRLASVLKYYRTSKPLLKFSLHNRCCKTDLPSLNSPASQMDDKLIIIIAYCIMPTHIHLLLQQKQENGISKYVGRILNSYTKYFNIRHNRKGPLWESKFKAVLVESHEQLLHLTKYIHLNPTTAYLTDKPENWAYSSYNEYVSSENNKDPICEYDKLLDLSLCAYKTFIDESVDYQREIAQLKNLTIE